MQSLKDWLNNHPAINVSQIEKEAELPQSSLWKFIKGIRKLPVKYHQQLLSVMRNYGFKGEI